ncbi:6-bladed beta-propeller [Saccharobesus litoralis]|uniref:6-bladed beta-propeller n=1 Tax=Saccharobesus litoralis TaxID=2172099 RepID=A0A2S0VNV8_9ALTE|nr:6-bladed beta-propeller [Saccharobesus litoralis]AWB65905.1 6-bladed beta-propeller [Saccharobesus litoralis]
MNKYPIPESGQDPHGMIIGEGDFKYRVNSHWSQLDPEKYPVENCHDMVIDKQGRIIMLTDNTQNNVIVYSQDGELIEAWGTEYPGAHSIEIVEEDGEEFLYIVDHGWVLNRKWDGKSTDDWDSPFNKVIPQQGFVVKLTLDGRLVHTIGHPKTIGIYQPDMPFRPSDIAVAPNGDIYITDGYGSDFVIQYDSNGRYIRHWGGQNNSDENYNLVNTHGIGVDLRNPNDPHLIVSSRWQQCLKLFSLDGTYRQTINTPGAYIHGPVFAGEHFFAPVCWSHIDDKNADDSGFISIFDRNNRVIANLGAEPPVYNQGELQPMTTNWQIFNHCHGMCIDKQGNLYIGQWRAKQTYPIKLEKI